MQELQQRRRSSQGLNERDVRVLEANIDSLETLSPRRTLRPARILPKPAKQTPDLYGVRPSFATIHNLQPAEGRFLNADDNLRSAPVCVLGASAKIELLGYGDGVGKFVKANDTWLEVVGVLKDRIKAGETSKGGQMEDPNNIIYVPFNTFQYRFWDMSAYLKDELDGIDMRLRPGADSVQVAKVVTAILNQTHNNTQDFSVTIPAALLAQQQRTQTIFTYVMVAIAAISLLEERAVGGLDQLRELHRPWIDEVAVSCEECGRDVRRVPEVGDAWLDAGIVPFSTLGWQSPEWKEHGYSNGAASGLSGADLPDHAYWEKWFPADWISENREQIRLWFYSTMFMSVTLVGRAPYERVLAYEKLRDETGREMHKSWGNAIEANEAMDRMGADVMRFMYADHNPSQYLNFGYGPANEVKRRLLTFWNSVSFFVMYATIEDFRPTYADLERGPDVELRPLDRWLLARTQHLVTEVTDAHERFWTPDITGAWERFVDDLSNWYIRRSRRRFYELDEAAFRTLWVALVQATRVIAPVMPFLAEHLWRNLVAGVVDDAPDSVFLAGWPEPVEALADESLVGEIAETRQVVELGRKARATSGLKQRQPLRRMVVEGAGRAARHAGEIGEELRVKDVEFGEVAATELVVKPNLRVLGPKLGKELGAVRTALQEGRFDELGDGRFRVDGHELGPEEVLVERRGLEGWAVAADDGLTVALDTALDADLELEGRGFDLIHRLNTQRKDDGLELTDRIVVRLPRGLGELVERHGEWIAREVLATSVELDDVDEPQIAKT